MNRGFTDKQKRFMRALVENGGNRNSAARTAGYANPRLDAYRQLQSPGVIAELRRLREARLCAPMATLALDTMQELMSDGDVSPAVRFQSARWVLEAAGHNSKEIKALGFDPDKPLTEMSLSELQAFIAAGSQAVETMKQPRVVNDAGPNTYEHDEHDESADKAADSAENADSAPDSAQSNGIDSLMG